MCRWGCPYTAILLSFCSVKLCQKAAEEKYYILWSLLGIFFPSHQALSFFILFTFPLKHVSFIVASPFFIHLLHLHLLPLIATRKQTLLLSFSSSVSFSLRGSLTPEVSNALSSNLTIGPFQQARVQKAWYRNYAGSPSHAISITLMFYSQIWVSGFSGLSHNLAVGCITGIHKIRTANSQACATSHIGGTHAAVIQLFPLC